MLVTLGWMLLIGFLPARTTRQPDVPPPVHATAAARVSVWTNRDDPYARGEAADVFLSVSEPSYVVVFRVDTDGRIRVLFPREPWTDSYVREERELQVGHVRSSFRFFLAAALSCLPRRSARPRPEAGIVFAALAVLAPA